MPETKKNCQSQYDLFVDTTNNFCYLAIYLQTKKIAEIKLKVNKNVTDLITDAIKTLLAKAKLHYRDINKIYLNIGPGSFTGIKVGVTIVKAWHCVYQPEIYVINSLRLQTKQSNSISLLDAKGQAFYTAIYADDKVILKPCLKSQKEAMQLIKKYPKYHPYINQLDEAYDLFIYHKHHFKKNTLSKLEPLYLKTPFKKAKT